MARRRLIAGNWKMHGWKESLTEVGLIAGAAANCNSEVVLCVPATMIADCEHMAQGTPLGIGAQTCHPAPKGAFTGEIAASMLYDDGAGYVILGHSERRAIGETDADVRDRVTAALGAGLFAIVCIGETAGERNDDRTMEVVLRQLADSLPDQTGPERVAIAYEPVWAIGSGQTPTPAQIGEVMDEIREALDQRFDSERAAAFRLLYGGSVTAMNAAEILGVANVDGALVGGASLTAEDFVPIIEAAG